MQYRKRVYTKEQIEYFLTRTKRKNKKEMWERLLIEAKQEIPAERIEIKGTRKKIGDWFIEKKETEIAKNLSEIKANPEKVTKELLERALIQGAPINRIKQQENKYKHMLEYTTTIWGEQNNQTIKIAEINENNKTIGELLKGYMEWGILEGKSIDPSTFHQEIMPGLNAEGVWKGQNHAYTIKAITTKTRLIKG